MFRLLRFWFLIQVSFSLRMHEKFAWKYLDYNWPSLEHRQFALQRGLYNPENNIILGVERWKNLIFVTVPRWRAGVPSSLNFIQLPSWEKSPQLNPYPSWRETPIFTNPVESTVVSTYRVQVDKCDRLWVIDNGVDNLLEGPKQVVPPAIVIFDLNRHQLIRRFVLPQNQLKNDTFLPNIVVDSSRYSCQDTFAYVPDAGSFGIIVYSFKENRSWRIQHSFFHIDPTAGGFSVAGSYFTWRDGVFGLALGSLRRDFSRDVYFHSLSGTKEFLVRNKVLQNESLSLSTDPAHLEFRIIGDRGPRGHSATEVFDRHTNVVFFTQLAKDGIGCWNSYTPLNEYTTPLVDQDHIALIMPVDIKLDEDGFLWVLSNRMAHFIQKKIDFADYNFRIVTGKASELIKGSVCDLRYF